MPDWISTLIDMVVYFGGTVFLTWVAVQVRRSMHVQVKHDQALAKLRQHAHDQNGVLHEHGLYLHAIARKLDVFVRLPGDTPPELGRS